MENKNNTAYSLVLISRLGARYIGLIRREQVLLRIAYIAGGEGGGRWVSLRL